MVRRENPGNRVVDIRTDVAVGRTTKPAAGRELLGGADLVRMRRHVKEYILPYWGNVRFTDIDGPAIEDWLYGYKSISNRYRRNIAGPAGLVFSYRGKPVSRDLLRDRLLHAVKNVGIDTKETRIVPYSGRYTFVTTVKPMIDRASLMAPAGHVDDAMPERYDIPVLTERMRRYR